MWNIIYNSLIPISIISIIRMFIKFDDLADNKLYDVEALEYLSDKQNRENIDNYVKNKFI